jgi:hypothetical protein
MTGVQQAVEPIPAKVKKRLAVTTEEEYDIRSVPIPSKATNTEINNRTSYLSLMTPTRGEKRV